MWKTLIVDDERLARSELKRLLQAHPSIEIVAEADSAGSARDILAAQPDIALVFLDIQMPGCTGLELAAELRPNLFFVFCTAFDSYALDAFALNALDYLVKPIVPQRLAQSLSRLPAAPAGASDTSQQSYLPDHHGLLLKFGENSRIVRLSEISRFESVGNHSAVYTPYGKSFVLSSLSRIEQRLDPQQFFKASRADIIRISAITALEPGLAAGSMLAILQDGQQIDVSRRQVQQLKTLFGGF
jgi:two-component system LytT family response regulator